MNWDDQLDFAGATDVGMRRGNNQDSFRLVTASSHDQWLNRGHMFVVADGMGAHAVGELASKMAVDNIPHTYHKLAQLPRQEAIVKAFQDANSLIHNRGVANQDFRGMGTTCTALILSPDGALIAHVGDSRAYRIRNGSIEQLSFDHSYAWELVRRRHLTFEQARRMVPNNVITRSLGPEADMQVDIEGPLAVEWDDVFVLCSDGLSGQVADAEIGILAGYLPAQEACQHLIDIANLHGGPDNITLIIVHVKKPKLENGKHPSGSSTSRSVNYATWCLAAGAASILGGVVLAGGLIATGLLSSYGLAAAAMVGLGVGLAVGGMRLRKSTEPVGEAAPAPKRQVFRPPVPCTLDKDLFAKVLARLQQLRDLAIERAWNVDWSEFFAHRQAAEKSFEAGNPSQALREVCQAQHLLAIAQRRALEQTQQLLGGT